MVSSSVLYTPSADFEQQRQEFLDNIVNKRIREIERQGYVEVKGNFIPPLETKQVVGVNTMKVNMSLEDMVLQHYFFTAKYTTLTKGETVYYFKTQQSAEIFLTSIEKYGKMNYTIDTSRKLIGAETQQDVLDKAIAERKAIAEKEAAERKKKEEAARRAAAQKKAQQQASSYVATNINGQSVVNYALQFNGNPYVYGGTSLTNGADCSGFVQSVYKHFGINLPRTTAGQATAGKAVSYSQAQPGDLILYSGNGGKSITHVAIYIGNGKIIHARTPAKGIGVTPATGGMVIMTVRRVI